MRVTIPQWSWRADTLAVRDLARLPTTRAQGRAGEPQIISVIRRPRELVVMTVSSTKLVPLAEVTTRTYPAKDQLAESWRYLSSSTAANADTLYHLLVVLLETVPDTSAAYRTAPIDPLPAGWNETAVAPVTIRPTAAHPRAYKGTKYQPPKARRLPETDLRPHLSQPRSLLAAIAPLGRFWHTVRPRLEKAGYADAALQTVAEEARLAPPGHRRPWNLPTAFVLMLWPAVRFRPERDRSLLLSLYTGLEMESDPELLAAYARLTCVAGAEASAWWGRLCEVLPAHRRKPLLEKLLATKAYASPLAAKSAAGDLKAISALATEEDVSRRGWSNSCSF